MLYQAALYIRLSREDGDKEESDSITNQRKFLMSYINKYEDIVFYREFVDDGFSGTNFNRPGFIKLLDEINKKKLNCVIVKDLSRFGRDYIETGRYLERFFPENQIRFIAINDNIDSLKKSYDMLLPIKNIFNEQYARDISKKVGSAIDTKQKSGDFIGAFASYGYTKSSKNRNRLIIDDYAAGVVRSIFDMYIKGLGKQSIAKKLNGEGILCPSEYKKLNGLNYKNSNKLESTSYWTYSTIHKILGNEIYLGNMVQGKKHQEMRGKQKNISKDQWKIVQNTHEAIIDIDTWNTCQKLIKSRSISIDLTMNINIFAGLVKCADCKRSMIKNKWKKADGSYKYYFNCGTYTRFGKNFCTPHTISLDVLYDIVLDELNKIIYEYKDINELINSQRIIKQDIGRIRSEINRINFELERVKGFKKSIYEDYKDELISKEEFLEYRSQYKNSEIAFEKQLSYLSKLGKEINLNKEKLSPWITNLLKENHVGELDREIVQSMVKEILVYNNKRLVIKYNFHNNVSTASYTPDMVGKMVAQ